MNGGFVQSGLVLFQRQSLPTDPIGSFTLTLTHLIIGSAIQIESTAGDVLHNSTADSTSESIALQVYAPGSPYNDLRIKVRKSSSAPFYQPYTTFETAIVGSRSIYVNQLPDQR